jgi:hypothetical protein
MVTRLIRVASPLPIAAAATLWADSPMVEATEPATGVAGNLTEIVITFDSEMESGCRGEGIAP